MGHSQASVADEVVIPKATMCIASITHSPKPVRFVTHHIQPQEAGGQSVPANFAQLCDNCHYSVHRLMWYLHLKFEGVVLTTEQQALLDMPPRAKQMVLATQGYNACAAAGTVAKIPNEG